MAPSAGDVQKRFWKDLCSIQALFCQSQSSESPKTIMHVMWKKGLARTQIPTNRNYAPELPTFGVIARVSYSVVQWSSLALREPPWWSWLPLCQVSMICQCLGETSLKSAAVEHFWAKSRSPALQQESSKSFQAAQEENNLSSQVAGVPAGTDHAPLSDFTIFQQEGSCRDSQRHLWALSWLTDSSCIQNC